MRQAFVLAGAKTLVMSLWKVPDQETKELMIDFYRRILDSRHCAQALRQAQLAMKDKYPDGCFTLLGGIYLPGVPRAVASITSPHA